MYIWYLLAVERYVGNVVYRHPLALLVFVVVVAGRARRSYLKKDRI